jgi:dTDP-L-rhamnose 4-epimerase
LVVNAINSNRGRTAIEATSSTSSPGVINRRTESAKPLVLITGGAGFIGSRTAEALIRAGYRVRILDCLDPQIHGINAVFPSHLNPEIECMYGDVRDAESVRQALQGVSFVYHFASLTGVGQSMYDIKNYTDVNLTGTANLIELIIKHQIPIKKFVLSSSRAVYGEGTHKCPSCGIVYPPIRNRDDMEQNRFSVFCPKCGQETASVPTQENRPLVPISVYGWTKKLQEEQCQYAAKMFGLPAIILRYFNVYGSGQSLVNPYTGVVSIFYSRLKAGKHICVYERGIPLRDFIHVSDVVRVNIQALKSDAPAGTVLNVGTGIEVSIYDVAWALARATGIEPEFEDHGEFRVGDIHACVADLTRINHYLNYEPRTSLAEGIREFVAWAQDQETADLYQKTVEELKTFGLFSQALS